MRKLVLIIEKSIFVYAFLAAMAISLIAQAPTCAGSEAQGSLFYFKTGTTQSPGDAGTILPSIGFGARFHRDKKGVDFSVNASSLLVSNYFSAKAVCLYYPLGRFYLGAGPGFGYREDRSLMHHDRGSSKHHFLNLEGIVGCEFHYIFLKTFVELEIAQPVYYFSAPDHKKYTPGIGLYFGTGF